MIIQEYLGVAGGSGRAGGIRYFSPTTHLRDRLSPRDLLHLGLQFLRGHKVAHGQPVGVRVAGGVQVSHELRRPLGGDLPLLEISGVGGATSGAKSLQTNASL